MKYSTRTGNYLVGFRRGGWKWQAEIETAIEWAIANGFGALDLAREPSLIKPVIDSGLKIGSVDLLEWQTLLSADAAERADAVAKNAAFVAECGAQNYFAVMLPKDKELSRKENFGYMAESLNALSPALEKAGGRLVIEGWPGPGALCCTPESFRATFKECPSKSIGINYDPSHLLRMGIDPIRFLKEFVARVGHVHGKDCEILADDLYEYGHEQPATFKESPWFGASAWRYTLPGHGGTNWKEVFRILVANGYKGVVSIELEDKDYCNGDEAQQNGLKDGAKFLSTC
jgi:sugar phosphate isomerase/epimerase